MVSASTKTISKKNLTLFLYPDDSDEAGQLLRIYQQYFMVSNAAQLILKEAEDNGYDLYRLYDHVASDQRYSPHHGDSGADPSSYGKKALTWILPLML